MKYAYIKVDGVIAISRLLLDYYRNNKINTIRIPSIFDVKDFTNIERKSEDNKIRLIYTGNVGKAKDNFKEVLIALLNYKNEIELNIYGSGIEEIKTNIGKENEGIIKVLDDSIHFYGRVDYEILKRAIVDSDYQIFVKQKRRSADAQFPTKLAESMLYGTPVITNDTGDIGLYVKDGINGYLCTSDSSKDICKVFDTILKNNKNKYLSLRENARKTAEQNFNYRVYLEDVKRFIDKI